jgi:hypothetical protein
MRVKSQNCDQPGEDLIDKFIFKFEKNREMWKNPEAR